VKSCPHTGHTPVARRRRAALSASRRHAGEQYRRWATPSKRAPHTGQTFGTRGWTRGPALFTLASTPPRRPTRNPSEVEAAFRQVDAALDQLCDTLGLKPAA
jgi:hypothetical protein